MSALPSVSLCPSCGNFAVLNEVTGWCGSCSQSSTGSTSSSSKTEMALAANADAIEFYITNGTASTTWQALALARQDRAVCIVCGEVMPHAPRTAVFCRRYAECRRYSRRYVYLYTNKGLSKVEAFARILVELT